MKKGLKIALAFSLILLFSAGFTAWYYWPYFFPKVTPRSLVFSSRIQGIYGENATYENNSWIFNPLYQASFWSLTQETYDQGYSMTIYLKERFCVISQSFWFFVNDSVRYMNATVYSNGSGVFFAETYSFNVLEFDFQLFSLDMFIIVNVDLMLENLSANEKEINL